MKTVEERMRELAASLLETGRLDVTAERLWLDQVKAYIREQAGSDCADEQERAKSIMFVQRLADGKL